jgi:hypothetical protein
MATAAELAALMIAVRKSGFLMEQESPYLVCTFVLAHAPASNRRCPSLNTTA